ncbi:MAG: YihY/virulence factor BrkB family protein [Candidatus Sulfotelmatobacter sp.]
MAGNIFVALRKKLASKALMFPYTKRALARTYHDVFKNQTFQAAAALSYYSILSVFPALILLSALMSYIPLPNFFPDVLVAIGRVAPPGTMSMVNAVLKGASSGAWLSLGTLGTLWVVSSAFDELIEALDAAYEVDDQRPFWKTRLLAVGLAALTAFFLICGIAAMIVGPRLGDWLAVRLSLSSIFIFLWPFIHWTLAVIFAVLAVETIYFLAPNVKQSFWVTLPGAVLCIACWMGLSYLLGIYFRYFENYNRIYGTLGGVMALMTWLYWAYFILLAGGELNSELTKEFHPSRLSARGTVREASGPAKVQL